MKLKFNKEGKSEETLKAYDAMEKDIAIDGGITKEDVTAVVKEETKNIASQLDADNPESLVSTMKVVRERVDNLSADKKKEAAPEKKSFNDNVTETLKENWDTIKNFRKGQDLRFEMKAVGDMSIAANFPAGGDWLTDVRTGTILNPYERVWLADLLPQATTTSQQVIYPRENGGEGGVAHWADKATAKPQMDFDFTTQTAYVKWLAGIVVIEREMLDDIAWMESYIKNRLLISYKTAQNSFILNGTADANPAQGLITLATAYDGTLTNQVERIIDAAYGQIPEDTFDWYSANVLVTQHRDAVALGLNKATGSGEYDLPQGAQARFVNGKLEFAGLQNVATSNITAGNFLVFDKNATSFITRMQPELRMTDLNVDNFVKNKITLRIEGRVALTVFNTNAIVKGTLAAAGG